MKWYDIIRHLAHRAPVEETSDTTNVSDASEVVSEETAAPSEGVTIISTDIEEYVEEEAPEEYESTVLTNEEISEVVASLAAIQSYFSDKNASVNISKVIHADFVGNISRDMYEIFHDLHVKYGDVHLMNPVMYLYILQQTNFRKSMPFIMNELFELYTSGQDTDLAEISLAAIEMEDEEYCQDEDTIDDEETEHAEKPYVKFADKDSVPVQKTEPRDVEQSTFRPYLPSEEETTDEEESNAFDCPVVDPDNDDIINDPLDNIVNAMTENGLTVEGE